MLKIVAAITLFLMAASAEASLGQFLFETNRKAEAWMAGLEEKNLRIADVEWHYYARNTEQDTCVVLLHGFTAEASHWFRFARKLEDTRCLIIPDLPGFGLSSYDPSGIYAIPVQATRLRDFLDAVKPKGALNVVGSSMGGQIAATYTLENPQRVATLSLVDAAGVESSGKSAADITLETTGKPIFHVTERAAFAHLMKTNMPDAPWMPSLVLDHLADSFIVRNERHMHIFGQIHAKNRIDARLGEIQCPTLILWGAEDHVLHPSMADRYAQLIKGSEKQVLNEIGHLPFLEAPGDVAERFEAFLKRE